MRLVYHPAVEAEVVVAARFYERNVAGLGAEFLREFDRSIALILAAPERWWVVRGDKRRFLMARFPYGIYYMVTGEEVRLLVLKHHSMHPDYGLKRE